MEETKRATLEGFFFLYSSRHWRAALTGAGEDDEADMADLLAHLLAPGR